MFHLMITHRGPSSHDAITDAANMRLCESPYPSIRRVRCSFEDGSLILRGHAGSFFHKQMAQEAVAGLDGVERVLNRIEVVG